MRKAAEKLDQRFTALVTDNRLHLATVAARNGEQADRLFVGQQSIINGIIKSTNSQTLREYADSARLWAAWNEQFGTRVAKMEMALSVLPQVLEQLARLEKVQAKRQMRQSSRRRPAVQSAGSCADRNQDDDVDKLFQAYMAGRYDAERNGGDTPPVA